MFFYILSWESVAKAGAIRAKLPSVPFRHSASPPPPLRKPPGDPEATAIATATEQLQTFLAMVPPLATDDLDALEAALQESLGLAGPAAGSRAGMLACGGGGV